ncbi:hypothetical protein [Streptomyces meridianus]|uniref:Secreted protein n=1 Tax=Streptomyces meridianus TaxID=2938945 RepID=A0ABT0WZS3_9ACTN|nr:hypothetical protein [Streptomyces meridianus]MCM2575815.1 hypothetical protein [Streptomyces meridianus]
MPRPTAAQLAYGTATVVLSTLAMLLLSAPGSATALTIVACAGLGLGLLVALTVPAPKATVVRQPRQTSAVRHRRPGTEPLAPGGGELSAATARTAVHAVAGSRRR